MDVRTVLFGLHELEGIGWKSIASIIQHTTELQNLFNASPAYLTQCGIAREKAEIIAERLSEFSIMDRLSLYNEAGVAVITIFDRQYPYLLKQTSQPPWVLYCKGNTDLLNRPLIAMVGTRVPTSYGKRAAYDLAYQLSCSGFGVVSGMARGIDSESHRGALQGEGGTVAVLGTAVNEIYPPENRSLYDEIAQKGLIVSEYPFGTKGHPGLFPIRNRIIAGLSLGTVVVEAALKSGSLITADQSMEESRDVFAVPGPITSPKSQGALSLLKQGAKIVTCAEDIMEEYRIDMNIKAPLLQEKEETELSKEELTILQYITIEPVTIDALLEKSKVEFGHLHSVLLSLLMKNKIEQLHGSTYVVTY